VVTASGLGGRIKSTMNRSYSDSQMNRSAPAGFGLSQNRFATTYSDQTARIGMTLNRSAPDLGRHPGIAPCFEKNNDFRRGAGIDNVAKAADEFPPLATQNEKAADKSWTRWTRMNFAHDANHNGRNWDYKMPPMDVGKGEYIPYTPYNLGRAAKDCRPNCFEFRAGYRHADYPLTKMSTSITDLPPNKKFYSQVHPKEIEHGRAYQWTFRGQDVGRASCRVVREMQGMRNEGE